MSDLKDKIAGLLAKAESTTFEEERDTYTAKAEALMLKYGIEQAELESVGKVKPEEITEVMFTFTTPFHAIVAGFVQGIAQSLGSLSVLQRRGSKQRIIHVYLIGHKTDVEHAEALINSLWTQANTAVSVWARAAVKDDFMYQISDSQGRWRARREFVSAFGHTVSRRIREERKVHEKTASTGAALVLVSKQERVDAWMHQQHNVGKARSQRLMGGHSGREAGRAAGERADIGNKRLGGTRGQLR